MNMMFEKQFIEPLQKGVKIHSIRVDEKNRWKGFRVIHFKAWSGKGYRSSMIDIIERKSMQSTQRVFMSIEPDGLHMTVGTHELFGRHEKEEFAINDGFKDWNAFEDYFYPLVEKMEDQTYTAKLIHWTDKRY